MWKLKTFGLRIFSQWSHGTVGIKHDLLFFIVIILITKQGPCRNVLRCWALSWQKLSTFFLQFRYRSDLMGMKGTGWLALRSPQMESAKKAGELISEVPAARPPEWRGQPELFLLNRELLYTVEIMPRWTQGLMDSKNFLFLELLQSKPKTTLFPYY